MQTFTRDMATLADHYCERHKCTREQFVRQAFWKCLYPHARLVAPFILPFNYDFFSADRALINSVADAVTMKRVREDVRDYFWDSENRGWLRQALNIRVSGQRVKNLCRTYLPEGETPLPFPSLSSDPKSRTAKD